MQEEFRKISLFELAGGQGARAKTPNLTKSGKESQACYLICMTCRDGCQLFLPPPAFVHFFHLLQLVLIQAESWNCLTSVSHCVWHNDPRGPDCSSRDTKVIMNSNNTPQAIRTFLSTYIYIYIYILFFFNLCFKNLEALVVAPQARIQIWRRFSRICRRAAWLTTGF